MKQLRFAAFLLLLVFLIVLLSPSSSGQSAQPPAPSRKPASPFMGTPDAQLDPGIRLKHHASNSCGSIVSYNFSPGDNPQLESVTTCTPADAIVTRRAQGKGKKPSAPLFKTTEYSTPPQ